MKGIEALAKLDIFDEDLRDKPSRHGIGHGMRRSRTEFRFFIGRTGFRSWNVRMAAVWLKALRRVFEKFTGSEAPVIYEGAVAVKDEIHNRKVPQGTVGSTLRTAG
jgi:hypothetical protein